MNKNEAVITGHLFVTVDTALPIEVIIRDSSRVPIHAAAVLPTFQGGTGRGVGLKQRRCRGGVMSSGGGTARAKFFSVLAKLGLNL